MMKISIDEIMQLSRIFSVRQLDILYGDIGKLPRQPDDFGLRTLVNKLNELNDYDRLSLLNSRFDLSNIFSTDEMEPATEAELVAAEEAFVTFIRQINPDFEMPISPEGEKDV